MNVELKSREAAHMLNDNLQDELDGVDEEHKDDDKEYDDEHELADMDGDMHGPNTLQEYADADILPGDSNDIFAETSAENILERMNKMAADEEQEQTSTSTASAITQQWEKDSRKDPEEEYFRLSCLALKIIYNEQDTDFVFTVSLSGYWFTDDLGIGGTWQVVSEMQETKDSVPLVVQLDREGAAESQRDAEEGISGWEPSQVNHRENSSGYLPEHQIGGEMK